MSAGPAEDVPGLRIEQDGAALWITLDAPETFNALTGEMTLGLIRTLRAVTAREDVRVVVLTGTGPAFSAGADLSGEDPHLRLDGNAVDAANLMISAVVECDKPVVCGLNGVAAGVGMSLAIACDLIVGTASASLTLAFSRIGLMPDGGSSATIAAAVGRARAMRMALLSDPLTAQEAYDAGLISHVFADDDYPAGLARVVARLAAGAPLGQAATKKAVNAATLGQLPAAMQRERAGQALLLRTDDAREGMQAFNDKRRPVFRGE